MKLALIKLTFAALVAHSSVDAKDPSLRGSSDLWCEKKHFLNID